MFIKKIGFIGLGAMGFPIAKHLLKHGFEVHVAKHSSKKESLDRIKELEMLGAKNKKSISEIPMGVDMVISILPSDKEVESVLLDEAFFNNIKTDSIILEMTSCSPETVIKVEEYYRSKNVKVIDAPVSGGVKGAINGSLTIFGSGNEEIFNEIKEVLDVFGQNIYYIGKLGAGKTLKSINQMMIAINTMGLIEGFSVAKKQGIDLNIMQDVISQSSGNSYSLNRYLHKLEQEDFEGGFKLSLMRKDIKTAIDSVDDIPLPFTNLVYDLFLMTKKYDDMDFIAISKLYK
ncbi:NAD(P)-dependent oxidoreductase [Tissierella praeacuta]|uniref:NAD(P)-dependent oxidoreductase n=1 Tax=Tissierella praeacuta TaxID=43131 RepID=UPI001C100F48|nr:NAD(P)-dependent oxidoreductase [Tissierella praeacuta]MBU5255048.1 NAD(P)-dependent oxidoreductase [Tissierella praeacuta]